MAPSNLTAHGRELVTRIPPVLSLFVSPAIRHHILESPPPLTALGSLPLTHSLYLDFLMKFMAADTQLVVWLEFSPSSNLFFANVIMDIYHFKLYTFLGKIQAP